MSYLDIMVSMLLLSFMLLGLNGMQQTALKESQAALFAVLANEQLKSLKELLKHPISNEENVINDWKKQVIEELPKVQIRLLKNESQYQIQLSWGESNVTCEKTNVEQAGGCIQRVFKRNEWSQSA